MRSRHKTLLLISALVLAMAVLAAGVIPLIVSVRYEKVIKERLPLWVAQATDGLYHVSVTDIDISTFTKNVTITGMTLRPDSSRLLALSRSGIQPKMIWNASVPRVEIRKIHWADLLSDKELSCDQLIIDHPAINIIRSSFPVSHARGPKKNFRIERMSARLIKVNRSQVVYHNHLSTDSFSIYWKGGSMEIRNWVMDPRHPDDDHQFFYAESGTIAVDSAVYRKHHSLYAFRACNIHFVSREQSLILNHLSIMPAMSRDEYYRRLGYREEIVSLAVPALVLQGFDWQQISNGHFKVRTMVARNPRIEVYLNRLIPPAPSKEKLFPVMQLQKLGFPVTIDTLRVVDAAINYTELSRISGKEATVPFRVFNASICNITNQSAQIRRYPVCIARLNLRLFGSHITSMFRFPLTDTAGAFEATASGTPFDGKQISILTEPLALMQIQSLNLHQAQFSIISNGREGRGSFLFRYDDLDLKVLKLAEDGSFKGKGFMSFIMNKALLYSANPMPGTPTRQINVLLTRRSDQSFFNFLWTSIRTGALLTAGRNPQLAKIAEH